MIDNFLEYNSKVLQQAKLMEMKDQLSSLTMQGEVEESYESLDKIFSEVIGRLTTEIAEFAEKHKIEK